LDLGNTGQLALTCCVNQRENLKMSEYYRFGLNPKWGITDSDVVTVQGQGLIKFGSFMNSIQIWSQKVSGDYPSPWGAWFTDKGVEIEILRTKGGGWQKGRLRFRLEFIPDDPEAFIDQLSPEPSPLDDLRSDLNIK
jgi:hypothetical protein